MVNASNSSFILTDSKFMCIDFNDTESGYPFGTVRHYSDPGKHNYVNTDAEIIQVNFTINYSKIILE